MSPSYINTLTDDLLVRILWFSQKHVPARRQSENRSDPMDIIVSRPRYTSENPYGDDLNTSDGSSGPSPLQRNRDNALTVPAPATIATYSPFLAPNALTDTAYNLRIASVCTRWRRLARQHVSMLVVKKNVAVSLQDLTAAVKCFPNLSHLHLSDNSVDTINDAFLDFLASSCPNLVSLHVGRDITSKWGWQRPKEHPVTDTGLDRFIRRCTQLQHLSLYCLHYYGALPDSLSLLTNLHTLALTEGSPLDAPGFTNLTSLTALSVGIPDRDDVNLASLAHLPAVSTLVLFDNTCLDLGDRGYSYPFSFAQMPSLKALEFERWSPQFELMFPPGTSFSRLERLLITGCESLERLPDDIGERLPRLRELSFCECKKLRLPEQFTSLSCLQQLTISSCGLGSLPENFGNLPALKTLTLSRLPLSSLPDSLYLLTSLVTLCISHCNGFNELPERFAFLIALNPVSIPNSLYLTLPEDIGSLTNLQTFRLSEYFSQQLLPSSFTQLSSLTRLELSECMVAELPGELGKLTNLRVLTLQACPSLQELPQSLTDLIGLEVLKVVDCDILASIPTSFSNFTRLRNLALIKLPQLAQVSGSLPCSLELLSLGNFNGLAPLLETSALPKLRGMSLTSAGPIGGLAAGLTLPSLVHLQLVLIGEAEEFPLPLELFSNLRSLIVCNAACMEKLPEGFGSALRRLRRLEIRRAEELTELPESFTELRSLTSIVIHAPELSSLPDGIGALSQLRQLNLEECSSLTLLPASLTRLSCLHELNLSCTAIRSLPCHFGQLSRLKKLNLDGCEDLAALPEDFTQLKMLHSLSVKGCGEIVSEGVRDMHGLQVHTTDFDEDEDPFLGLPF